MLRVGASKQSLSPESPNKGLDTEDVPRCVFGGGVFSKIAVMSTRRCRAFRAAVKLGTKSASLEDKGSSSQQQLKPGPFAPKCPRHFEHVALL